MKICSVCQKEKLVSDFYIYNDDQTKIYSSCKECYRKKQADYQRLKYSEYRNNILIFLGGKCINCGYNDNVLGLEIDHVNNDGKTDRGENRRGFSATDLKRHLKNNCKGLQLLCGTCHSIKTRTK